MYRPSQRQSIFAAHSSVQDLPPLVAPDEEMAVLTPPMIRHMQRDVIKKKKSKPKYLPGEKLLKRVSKFNTPEPEPEPEDNLDLEMIQSSINTVLERMRI